MSLRRGPRRAAGHGTRASAVGLRSCLAAVAASCLLAAVGAPLAGAATYCVDPATGCGGGTLATLTLALTAAHDNPGPDDVRLGPVLYLADGPWSYEDLTGTNPVIIRGDESGNSQLSSAAGTTLTLENGNLHLVRIRSPAGATGLHLRYGTVSDADFTIGTDGGGVNAAHATIERAFFRSDTPADPALAIDAGDNTTITDVTSFARTGVNAFGSHVVIRRATLSLWGHPGVGIRNHQSVEVSDSLIQLGDASDVGLGADCWTDFAGSSNAVTNVTISGPGAGTAFQTFSGLLCLPGLAVGSSLITGVGAAVACLGTETSNVSISYSDVDLASPGAVDGACQPGVDAGHNFFVDPKLNTDVPYKPVPRFDSPLVDAGDPIAPGAEQPTDRLGLPRAVNGRRDIGAFEYGRRPPDLSVESSAPTALPGQRIQFTAETSDPDPGDAVNVDWVFDDGATKSGPTAEHAFSGEGPHTATAIATDSAGVSTRKTLTVVVAGSGALPSPPDLTRRDQPTPLVASDLLGLPSAKRCLGKRELRIRVRRRAGVRVVSVVITVNGKRRHPIKRQAGIRDPLMVRSLPVGRSSIKVALTTSDGRSLKIKRKYQSCAAKRRKTSTRHQRSPVGKRAHSRQ